MDANTVTLLCAVLGSGVLSTTITQIISHVDKKKEKKNGMNQGVRLILKDRLRFLCVHYIEQGWIYCDELEDIMAMHAVYHTDLGGNGYLDALMAKVKSLPVKGTNK